MNRPIHFFETRSPDRNEVLASLVEALLVQINEPKQQMSAEHWVVYCNDQRVDRWNLRVRARSRLLLVRRASPVVQLNVAFQNRQIVVVDKPPNLPTQKTLKAFEDNLYDQVRLAAIQEKNFPRGLPYVGLHHRLDRGTSGLVLLTRQREVNKEVSDLFKNRKIQKEYLAYVQWGSGDLPPQWHQEDKIQRGNAKKKKFFFEVGEKGDLAVTDFKVVSAVPDDYYLIRCRPKTGRTHQLRVQLAHKGHPILGDGVYGNKKSGHRLMLHAHRLQFTLKGEKHQVESQMEFQL